MEVSAGASLSLLLLSAKLAADCAAMIFGHILFKASSGVLKDRKIAVAGLLVIAAAIISISSEVVEWLS